MYGFTIIYIFSQCSDCIPIHSSHSFPSLLHHTHPVSSIPLLCLVAPFFPSQMAPHHVHRFNEHYPKVAWKKVSHEIGKKVRDKKSSFRNQSLTNFMVHSCCFITMNVEILRNKLFTVAAVAVLLIVSNKTLKEKCQ